MATNTQLEQLWPHDAALLEDLAARSPTVLIAFSRGKDSIAAYLAMRDSGLFERIIPYHMFLIPDLSFEQKSLRYFEKFFKTKIYEVPHPSLYRMLRNQVFQPPDRVATIDAANLPAIDYLDVIESLCEDLGLGDDVMIADGVRCCDSPMRRLSLQKYGPIRKRKCSVVWNWNKRRVMDTIEAAGCVLPVDYEMFNRSFDGIDYRFLEPLRTRFPADYAKIKELFPLCDLEFFRHAKN